MTGKTSKNKVLLIIDDDEIFQFAAKQINKQDQIFDDIQCYSFIEKALNFLHEVKGTEHAPDVILLDIRLDNNGESGWSFLQQYDTPGLQPIVQQAALYIVSSSIDQKDKERADRHPLVNGYLEKPLRFGDLKKLL